MSGILALQGSLDQAPDRAQECSSWTMSALRLVQDDGSTQPYEVAEVERGRTRTKLVGVSLAVGQNPVPMDPRKPLKKTIVGWSSQKGTLGFDP